MARYLVRISLALVDATPEEAAEFFAGFQKHLVEALECPAEIEHVPSDANYEFDCFVEIGAESAEAAVVHGSNAVRTAAHAVDVSTRKWPEADQWPAWLQSRYVEATALDDAKSERSAQDVALPERPLVEA